MASDGAAMDTATVLPTDKDLRDSFYRWRGDPATHGWRRRMRFWFDYFEPDDWYEELVDKMVTKRCTWIDVGGGRDLFPQNLERAQALAKRCLLLVGVDPSENIEHNQLVHERIRSTIEGFRTERSFDLATLRMVAEHIPCPESAVQSLARLLRSGGRVVVYTPNRWSPAAVAASMIPFCFHHLIKRFLSGTEKADAFPTVYKMNTRKRLCSLFESSGFKEVAFVYLDDCRIFQRFRLCCFLELALWRILRMLGLKYPENNLLGVYEKT